MTGRTGMGDGASGGSLEGRARDASHGAPVEVQPGAARMSNEDVADMRAVEAAVVL